ncbi:anti-sigma factor family protein [Paraburkholderia rhizosphaerae]|uniref:Anti-sigma factor RsiW n=1 Tax=Paraburkholderia rhizosphaerae TaxID=480658 RepID=A0A4R8LSQ4_9BURK|nr:anti-sigma factor [Paraburkholderia rhizosphaerae]TDY49795.1 anti-sigma factor RsiW [Paraburkholderia rhizosphaerae]
MAHSDSTIDPPLTEADIQAFADGSLSPERSARVQRYLGSMPGEASRIAFYRRLNGQMQRSFIPQGSSAPGDSTLIRRSLSHGWRAHAQRAWHALSGSVAQRIALLVLALAGWAATAFVSDHQFNATAVMSYAQWAGAPTQMAATPVPASRDPFSTEFAQLGWKLVSVKTLRLGLISDAQEFDYRNADGQPIVLLTTGAPFVIERPHWMGHRVGELRLLTWTDNGTRYVLAGRADAHGLMKAADAATFH